MYNKKMSLKDIISIITVSLLAVLMALSYQLFVVENNFAPAGLNGIATMIQYKTGFSIGYMSLLINVPLCILGFFLLSKKFAVRTLIFSVIYSFSFLLFQNIGLSQFQYITNGHNTIFPVILSGVLSGFIYGICFLNNSSTGGTDIIAKYISFKKPNFNFFWIAFTINAIIAVISFFVYAKPNENGSLGYDYSPVCLCILYCFLSNYVGNYIVRGTKTATKFTIVTEHPDEIAKEITTVLKHGSTKINAIGTYRYESKSILICVINKHQLVNLQEILRKYDNTFSFSETVNATYGNFKYIKNSKSDKN